MALRQARVNTENASKVTRHVGKSFFQMPEIKSRPALGSLGNAQKERNGEVMKRKGLVTKQPPVAKLEPVVEPVAMPRQPTPVPSPEAMDMGKITEAFSQQLQIEDIDMADSDNPQLCAEYAKDIYVYMKELELKYHVPPTYMKNQPHINERMRCILIDWLIQVHHKFSLLQETLYLTISTIDRYLQNNPVEKTKLQLVGVTAMLIASKYEEMYAPEVRDFVYITDNAYNSAEIRAMEQKMLRQLDFSFGNPLCLHFLRRDSRAGDATPEMHTMAKFLMELCLQDYTMLQYLPSQQAAAALYLSIKMYETGDWTPTLHHYSTYSEEDLLPCAQRMAQLVLAMNSSKQQAVRNKYSGSKFLRIAKEAVLQGRAIKALAEAAAASRQ